MTYGKGKWNSTRKNPHESITRGSLIEKAKVWFYFICSVLLPSRHLNTVREKEVILLYAILMGYKFSVGKIIKNYILSYYRGSYRGLVPYPALITRLCILGGLEGDWQEEETCPKASSLTLIGVMKGPKNRDKEKEIEIEEEEASIVGKPRPRAARELRELEPYLECNPGCKRKPLRAIRELRASK